MPLSGFGDPRGFDDRGGMDHREDFYHRQVFERPGPSFRHDPSPAPRPSDHLPFQPARSEPPPISPALQISSRPQAIQPDPLPPAPAARPVIRSQLTISPPNRATATSGDDIESLTTLPIIPDQQAHGSQLSSTNVGSSPSTITTILSGSLQSRLATGAIVDLAVTASGTLLELSIDVTSAAATSPSTMPLADREPERLSRFAKSSIDESECEEANRRRRLLDLNEHDAQRDSLIELESAANDLSARPPSVSIDAIDQPAIKQHHQPWESPARAADEFAQQCRPGSTPRFPAAPSEGLSDELVELLAVSAATLSQPTVRVDSHTELHGSLFGTGADATFGPTVNRYGAFEVAVREEGDAVGSAVASKVLQPNECGHELSSDD